MVSLCERMLMRIARLLVRRHADRGEGGNRPKRGKKSDRGARLEGERKKLKGTRARAPEVSTPRVRLPRVATPFGERLLAVPIAHHSLRAKHAKTRLSVTFAERKDHVDLPSRSRGLCFLSFRGSSVYFYYQVGRVAGPGFGPLGSVGVSLIARTQLASEEEAALVEE